MGEAIEVKVFWRNRLALAGVGPALIVANVSLPCTAASAAGRTGDGAAAAVLGVTFGILELI